jgi:hypothetical protein
MAPADPRRLHPARRREVGRTEADALHAGRGGRDVLDVLHTLGRLEDGVQEDGLADAMLRFKKRQELIDEVNVPGPFDLRHHDHIELRSGRRHDLGQVVQRPGRVEGVHPDPKPGPAEIVRVRQGDEAPPRFELHVRRDRILEVAEHHVDPADELADLGAHLVDMRRDEMDHPLEPHGHLAQGKGRAERERLEEATWQLHRT